MSAPAELVTALRQERADLCAKVGAIDALLATYGEIGAPLALPAPPPAPLTIRRKLPAKPARRLRLHATKPAASAKVQRRSPGGEYTAEQDAEITRLWNLGVKVKGIGKVTGRAGSAVQKRAHKLGLPGRQGRTLLDAEPAQGAGAASPPVEPPAPKPAPKPKPVRAPKIIGIDASAILALITVEEKQGWPGLPDAVKYLCTSGRIVEKISGRWLIDKKMVSPGAVVLEAGRAKHAAKAVKAA